MCDFIFSKLVLICLIWLPTTLLAQTEPTDPQGEASEQPVQEAEPEPAPTPPETEPPPDPPHQLLADNLPSQEVVWLNIGEDQLPTLALFRSETSGGAHGGVIILADQHHSPTRSYPLDTLRKTLPDHHWHSLVVAMPAIVSEAKKLATHIPIPEPPLPNDEATEPTDPDTPPLETEPEPEPSKEVEEPETAPDGANTALVTADPQPPLPPKQDSELTARQHIDAAILYFNGLGIFNMVIVGEGTGASRAIEYIKDLKAEDESGNTQQVRGIIMINARNHLQGKDVDISLLIPKLSLPVLDIYFGADYRNKREARQRQKASRALPSGQYTQFSLAQVAINWQDSEDPLSKRVRGWLNTTAAGFSVQTYRR